MPATRLLRPDASGIAAAAALLRQGGLVAFPTETVYGLGADATDSGAVAALYAAKGRPAFNPLIAHLTGLEAALPQGRFDAAALELARAFWPGALTLVVPLAPGATVCDLARAGLDSVALRVPAHPLAHAMLAAAGRPIVAPSANRSGHVSPTAVAHVMADLEGRIDAVIDAGAAPIGLESTIIACLGGQPLLLRAGGVTREAIEQVIGKIAEAPKNRSKDGSPQPLSPGLLASHYAPRAKLRLEARALRSGEAALLFGDARPPGIESAPAVLDLSRKGDLAEAAANLFAHLRELDARLAGTSQPRIAVVPIPESGLGEAINDRLRRAAADR
ncbi:L-threonylcarbamoyladenylate synthase [Rhizobiales bacterium GAS113]|nr:L-threonylcarbamoyladenylate synthase [Rhizobiales bacterium GAS113]